MGHKSMLGEKKKTTTPIKKKQKEIKNSKSRQEGGREIRILKKKKTREPGRVHPKKRGGE